MRKQVKDAPIRCTLRVGMRREKTFWGPGVAQLLHGIEEKRSLRSAAQTMEMSYSKAWKIIHDAEKELGFKLIESTAGGALGGGSTLTPQGDAILQAYDSIVSELEQLAQAVYEKHIQSII